MNKVIAVVKTELVKKQPESTMGNWCTDAMLWGIEKAGLHADFALMNYGGMRIPVITPGPLTMGELFELSPFDNALMIVDVPGNFVDTMFQHIASKDGWPVSDEVRMTISQKKMIQCTINGAPIDPAKTYKVLMPDYVATR
jgi:2',3'-cyclic-nucleotide 2'-phosphodiesterase (5'-nucleotidase family)